MVRKSFEDLKEDINQVESEESRDRKINHVLNSAKAKAEGVAFGVGVGGKMRSWMIETVMVAVVVITYKMKRLVAKTIIKAMVMFSMRLMVSGWMIWNLPRGWRDL